MTEVYLEMEEVKMRGHLKRLTGIFLCIVMVLGNLPVNALAAEQEETGKYLPTDQEVTILLTLQKSYTKGLLTLLTLRETS